MHRIKSWAVCALTILAVSVFRPGPAGPAEQSPEKEYPAEKKTTETPAGKKKSRNIPEKIIRDITTRTWYKEKKVDTAGKRVKAHAENDTDLSSIKESSSDDISSIIVLVGEIPLSNRKGLYAPIFLTDRKNIFGSGSDFSFKWVGYKFTTGLTQKGFPWGNTTLSETFVASFLYASGTNIGFSGGKQVEERRFYTNYTSEIVTLKTKTPGNTAVAFTLDSRQYFFLDRNVPPVFIMPENHVNVFPRLDLNLEMLHEKGIDQLAKGVEIRSWAGYGIRSKWHRWGEPGNLQEGEDARTFMIYSAELTAGLLFAGHHNLVFRAHYKGGIDNDFLTRPRFGGTIDNARLDVVHGFTVDRFRVNAFGLANVKYGLDLWKRLRMNLFLDYAHIQSPDPEDILGSAYGFRILAFGGLPIWITHGIGKRFYPANHRSEQTLMIMTAAGW